MCNRLFLIGLKLVAICMTVNVILRVAGLTTGAVFAADTPAELLLSNDFDSSKLGDGWYMDDPGYYSVVNGELKSTGATPAGVEYGFAGFVPKAGYYTLEARIATSATAVSSHGIAVFKGDFDAGTQNAIFYGVNHNSQLYYMSYVHCGTRITTVIPGAAIDRTVWHLYKIALQADGTFTLYFDGEVKASGILVGDPSHWDGGYGPGGDGALYTKCLTAGVVLNTCFDDVKVYGLGSTDDIVATPSISPGSGAYADSVGVSITCATSGATVRYTTDGSDPTSSSPQYTESFKLTADATVKARAFKTGMTDSEIASASFTVNISPSPVLVGYWKLDGSADDDSENNNDGTLVGSPTWISGKSGSAVNLTGITDAVSVTGLAAYKSPLQVAVAVWIKTGATDTQGGDVVSMGDNYAVRIMPDGNVLFFYYKGGNAWVSATTTGVTATDGNWHHLVGQKTAAGLEVYVDGVLKTSYATTAAIDYGLGSDLMIGNHGNGGTGFGYMGAIDEARLYNHALSASEISSLYNDTTGIHGSPRITVASLGPARRQSGSGIWYDLTGKRISDGTNTGNGVYLEWNGHNINKAVLFK